MRDAPVLIVNPLSSTLQHYEHELVDTLRHSGHCAVEVAATIPGDGVSGRMDRLRIMARSLFERAKMGRSIRGRIVIVAWPLFGYLDPLTFVSVARSNRVFIVLHDPTPLRKSYGYSALARLVFKWVAAQKNMRVIYHTSLAQEVGMRASGVAGQVIPHPVLMSSDDRAQPSDGTSGPVIRVLGQNKQTRSLAALQLIAGAGGGQPVLEIYGRGWPAVAGWKVFDGFVPEAEFTLLLRSSDCVVIPYESFFQSGVAARCLELGVRVVAPRHEHIIELYGPDWPGLVRDASDWHDAIVRALKVEVADIRARRESVRHEIRHAWHGALDQRLPVQRDSQGRGFRP